MTFWIIIFIIVGIIACIIDGDSFCAKLALAMIVSSIAFLLLRLTTGLSIMMTLARISATLIVVSIFLGILIAIFKR